MIAPKPIDSLIIKEGMKSIAISNEYSNYAGTPQEEELVAKEAIKKYRQQRYENFRREQYHNNYANFAMPLKEKNIVKPEEITLRRHAYFEMYCQDSTQEGHIKFAGTEAEENEAVAAAILMLRKHNEANSRLKKYSDKIMALQNKKVEYKTFTSDQFFDFITTKRAVKYFGTHSTGPLAGQPKFKLDDQARAIITPLCEYFTKDPKFEERFFEDPATNEKIMFSLDKGILLFSECGYGKTDTMRLFASNPSQSFMVVNCLTTEEDFSIEGDDSIRKYYTNPINTNPKPFFGHEIFGIMFDNLGLEKQGKYYGSTEEVMEKILFQRYHRKDSVGGKTHITTNFSRAYIKERYGPAIYSRLFEMFNFLTFPVGSVDRRKSK